MKPSLTLINTNAIKSNILIQSYSFNSTKDGFIVLDDDPASNCNYKIHG